MPVSPDNAQLNRYTPADLKFLEDAVRPLDGGNDQPPLPPTEDNHDNGGRRERPIRNTLIMLIPPTIAAATAVSYLLAEALINVAR